MSPLAEPAAADRADTHHNPWLEAFGNLVELIRERRGREPTDRELRKAFEAAIDGKAP